MISNLNIGLINFVFIHFNNFKESGIAKIRICSKNFIKDFAESFILKMLSLIL